MAGQLLGKAILLGLVYGVMANPANKCQKNFPEDACPEGQFCAAPGKASGNSQYKCLPCPCNVVPQQCTFNSDNVVVCDCTGSGYTGATCTDDIDECADSTLNNCSPNAFCTNTIGSFTCTCNQGYSGDGVTCNINGGWSTWENWGTCSATCGVGMRIRTRSCTRPRPEGFGEHCFGDSHEVELCETGSCTRKVAFNAYITNNPGFVAIGTVLIFPEININDGYGYDTSSGIFTAPVPGVYYFEVHVCNAIGWHIVVAIFQGERRIATTTAAENQLSQCSSVNAISRVEVNENVFVKVVYEYSNLRAGIYRWPSFSGYLMYQDD